MKIDCSAGRGAAELHLPTRHGLAEQLVLRGALDRIQRVWTLAGHSGVASVEQQFVPV